MLHPWEVAAAPAPTMHTAGRRVGGDGKEGREGMGNQDQVLESEGVQSEHPLDPVYLRSLPPVIGAKVHSSQ